MRPHLLALALLASAPLLGGCKSPCRQLAEMLCDCRPNTLTKEDCLQEAQQHESNLTITPEQQSFCQEKLDDCDCHLLESPDSAIRAQEKRDCGLAL
jgi:hypothetical protein